VTPDGALLASSGPCALFESTTPPGSLSRLSLLARDPRAVFVLRDGEMLLATEDGLQHPAGSPWTVLRELLSQIPPGSWPHEGGLACAVAYDLARPQARHDAGAPLLMALAVDRFLVFENGRRVAEPPASRPPLPVIPALAAQVPESHRAFPEGEIQLPVWSSYEREHYRGLVGRVKEHIAAGDIYQANLSQRFRLPWPKDGLSLYRQLRRLSPAPFSGYFRAAGLEIVSASPERLLRVEDGRASTRPIAGTRPRSPDPSRDQALARELLLSEKERAEHLMLVDLARNDLGKVAALGSVEVDELMVVEHYSHVRHIVSNVCARLAPGRDAIDALRALFPGGTITGVPKRRCMEILDELEEVPRGFYTGSLFYLTTSGVLDANILIRSAVVTGGCVSFHTGGGIVADSDPDREYEETLHKAEGLRLALQAAFAED
jgi:anthranilate/para-aminobenzoate synthase component I